MSGRNGHAVLTPPPRRGGRLAAAVRSPLDAREESVLRHVVSGDPPPPTVARLLRAAPASFANIAFGKLAALAHELAAAGTPVNVVTLGRAAPELAPHLATLAAANVPADLAEYDAQTVLEAYHRRQLGEALEWGQRALADTADPATVKEVGRVLADTAKTIDGEDHAPDDALPAWEDFAALAEEDVPTPPALVDGLIRLGEKCVLGGASKSFKSWLALDLAVAVAHGLPWLGRETTQGTVLLVNLELPPWAVRKRLLDICAARAVPPPEAGRLFIWNLRDQRITAGDIRARLRASGIRPALVIVDPAYKLLAGRDENAAGDIGELLGELGGIAGDTGAAAHFAKGNAAGKDSVDRISGSGVFARDPDTILTLTRHEEDGAFALEATLRTFPPCEPFAVRWALPVFSLADDLNPSRLKKPEGQGRRYEDEDLIELLETSPLSHADWKRAAMDDLGMSGSTFENYRRRLWKAGLVIECATTGRYWRASAT